jgi:hypothetical protein
MKNDLGDLVEVIVSCIDAADICGNTYALLCIGCAYNIKYQTINQIDR